MRSLFLAWQAPEQSFRSRAWFPVGRLDVETNESTHEEAYRFRSTGGAKDAQEMV